MRTRSTPCTECRKQRRKCLQTDPDEPCLRCINLGRVCIDPDIIPTDPNNGTDDLKEQLNQLSLTIKKAENELKAIQYRERIASQYALKKICYNWKVKIHNGCFKIDTGIQRVSEILRYQPSISYLSPINSRKIDSDENCCREDDNILVNFTTQKHGGLYSIAGNIVLDIPKEKILSAVSSALDFDPFSLRRIVDRLVGIYFSCHNLCIGLIHEVSFKKKFEFVHNFLDDLVGIAICCYVCSMPCRHLGLSTQQRRTMCDFFYSKAKNIIIDQFDDPKKKTENVTAILLLYQYVRMTLRFKDYDRYLTMAYQICLEMKAYYSEKEPQSTVEYALYTRHLSYAYGLRVMVDCATGKNITQQPIPFPQVAFVLDESETFKKFLQVTDNVVSVYRHPFVDTLIGQIHHIYTGDTCNVRLDMILNLDEVVNRYRTTLSGQGSFCKDIYSEEKCKHEIDNTDDFFAILTFIHITTIVISLHAAFLQPVSLTNGDKALLEIIREQSFKRSQIATRLVLYAVKKIIELECISCSFQSAVMEAMFYVLDTLILQCSANGIGSKAGKMFCMAIKFIEKYRNIHQKELPPFAQKYRCDIPAFICNRKANAHRYIKYPDPWCALMHDLSMSL